MFALMVLLAGAGIFLVFGAPLVARVFLRGRDPVGLTRVLQLVGIALLVVALLVRPHNNETAVFKPPPDAPADSAR